MKTMLRLIGLLLAILTVTNVYAQRPRKILLTGTLRENVEMTVGNTGRKEIITSLPYEFSMLKDQLPVTLTFRSDNYVYYPIQVPEKPRDATGHIYLVKIDETATERMFDNKQRERDQEDNDDDTGMDLQNVRCSDVDTDIPLTSKRQENTFAVIIDRKSVV